jgi:hypothetical protein
MFKQKLSNFDFLKVSASARTIDKALWEERVLAPFWLYLELRALASESPCAH